MRGIVRELIFLLYGIFLLGAVFIGNYDTHPVKIQDILDLKTDPIDIQVPNWQANCQTLAEEENVFKTLLFLKF